MRASRRDAAAAGAGHGPLVCSCAQWQSRARLLDPLTRAPGGFQFPGCDRAGDAGVVVFTVPGGGF